MDPVQLDLQSSATTADSRSKPEAADNSSNLTSGAMDLDCLLIPNHLKDHPKLFSSNFGPAMQSANHIIDLDGKKIFNFLSIIGHKNYGLCI